MKGIAAAGTIVVDILKDIDFYPQKGMLARIVSLEKTTGGCVCNTLLDLSRLDPSLPLYAFGRVGEDENGVFVREKLQQHGIHTENVRVAGKTTGFTDVMNDSTSGERTFFNSIGVNQHFCAEDVDIDAVKQCGLFHIGYVMLMRDMEAAENGESQLVRLLKQISDAGVKTSIDAVSVSGGGYEEKILPLLPYCDYVVMNEIEACAVVGTEARRNGALQRESVQKALHCLIDGGVRECAVVHAPEGCFAMRRDKILHKSGSLILPKDFVKASVGAGDAFCAGFLYAALREMPLDEALDFASCVAACNLSESDAYSGIKKAEEVIKFGKQYERREL